MAVISCRFQQKVKIRLAPVLDDPLIHGRILKAVIVKDGTE